MSNLLFSKNFMKARAIGFMIASSACWGVATVMSKAALQYIPPLHLLAIQLASSIIFLWVLLFITNQRLPVNWTTMRYSFTGILEPGLAYMFGMLGLVLTTASNASLISTTEPIIIILLSWLLLQERITRVFLFCTGLSFTGVILIILSDINFIQINQSSWLGDLLILLGTFCASFYVIFSHKIIGDNKNISPLCLACIQQTAGFILITIVWRFQILGNEIIDYSLLTPNIWLLAIISGIVQYALAFWFYLIALTEVTASTAALFLTLIPIFAISAAYLFLREKLTMTQWLGSILIFISVSSVSIIQQHSENQE